MEEVKLTKAMSLSELKNYCGSVGLTTNGSKQDLINRYETAVDAGRRKEVKKPTRKQLKMMCKSYKITGCHTRDQCLQMLEKNQIEWSYVNHAPQKELRDAVEHPHPEDVVVNLKRFGHHFVCDVCGGKYGSVGGYSKHKKSGHIDCSDKLTIKQGETDKHKWKLELFDLRTDNIRDMSQIVLIPWYVKTESGDEKLMNVSIGATYGLNVTLYARDIWYKIQLSLKKQTIYLEACGSGRVLANRLKWYMKPDEARSVGAYVLTRVVASKVKGFIRELVDAVHVFSASDEWGYLNNCSKHLVDTVEASLGYMADANEEAFDRNILGLEKTLNDPKKARVYIIDPTNELRELDW